MLNPELDLIFPTENKLMININIHNVLDYDSEDEHT